MDRKLRARFEAAFHSDRERLQAEAEDARRAAEVTQDFAQRFKLFAQTNLRPVMEEFATAVKGQGWQAIVVDEGHVEHTRGLKGVALRIVLQIARPGTPIAGRNDVPAYSFTSDSGTKKVLLHISMMGHGGRGGAHAGDDGQVDLETLTPEFIQEKLTRFIEKVVRGV